MMFEFRVDIFRPGQEEYPFARHSFFGRTPAEAKQHFYDHVAVDGYLKSAVETGLFRGKILAVAYKMLRKL